MLMNALAESPAAAASLVRTTISRWSDLSYFDDVLERLSYYYAGRRQWNEFLEIFFSLENRGPSASLAQYAWIVGRAVEEGYLRTFYRPERFFRTAFETENASFYYRALAAAKLGLSLVPEGENSVAEKTTAQETAGLETDFLLGFFEYGAASFSLPYIQAAERRLPVQELRKIAAALAASGRHKESLDLVSRYIDLEGPPANREDLLLYYPQPFKETVERYASEAELAPEILYALIRTESYFKPDIVSSSGAVGLVQLMSATAEEMADRIARRGGPDYRVGGLDLKDPETSIHIGSYYLSYLNAQMGSPLLALLAYNGGMGRVRNWLAADRRQGGLPEDLFLETIEYLETRDYGRKVLAAAAIYGYLYYGKGMEEVAGIIGE
jgi:soluble lytic murein transglycosylase